LVLNEVLCAEKDVASASRYRLMPDKKDLGMFKSSGVIVATGTGSNSWLYNARQMNGYKIQRILDKLGSSYQSSRFCSKLARNLSVDTQFDPTEHKMFFFIREGFSLTQMTEGFCWSLKIESEMLDGQVVVDGWKTLDFNLGDKLLMDASDEKVDLTVMSLQV
jgi:hypothetical protein